MGVQFRIWHTNRPQVEAVTLGQLPEGETPIAAPDGRPFYGGSDLEVMTPAMNVPGVKQQEIEGVLFAAKQGKRQIVKERAGTILDNGAIRLMFRREETNKWRDGYMVMQITVILRDGRHIVAQPSWVHVAKRRV